MAERRFVKVYDEGIFGSTEIFVDTKTGVNYLWHAEGYAGGLTVLLDRDGKPLSLKRKKPEMHKIFEQMMEAL